MPVVSETEDPLVLQNAEIGDDRWRFAVMSDSQFVAKSPNSQQAKMAKETLQQIVEQNPEFLIVGGDLVDTAYPEDFEMAKAIVGGRSGG